MIYGGLIWAMPHAIANMSVKQNKIAPVLTAIACMGTP
jgi:hypothetical protein